MIVGCLLVALCGDPGYCDEQEYRLTRYLMSNYDPAVRPSENASLPLTVKIQVLLQKIQQLVSTVPLFPESRATDTLSSHSPLAARFLRIEEQWQILHQMNASNSTFRFEISFLGTEYRIELPVLEWNILENLLKEFSKSLLWKGSSSLSS